MARVSVSEGCVLVKVSWLERWLFGERSHRLEISDIRDVDPHPSLKDLMVHWLSRSAIWVNGLCSYEGQLIPSTRNPTRTLAITLNRANERVFVELDEETTEVVAERIREAISSVPPPPSSDLPPEMVEPALMQGIEPVAAEVEESEQEYNGGHEALATALIGVGSLSLGAGLGTWISQGAPSPLALGASMGLLFVMGVGYAVMGR